MTLILSGTDGLSDVDGTAATPAVRGTDTNTGIFFPAADTVAASVGGTEGLRLTTTGLGVATSTPNSIGGNSNARYFGLAGDGTLSSADGRVILSNPRAYASIVANSTTAGRIYFQLPNASTGTTTEAAFIDSIASGSGGTSGYGIDIRFGPKADNGSANERMRLDQAGNLGLGVTPSAWGSDTRALQIFNRTSLSDLQSTTQLTNNGIWNGTNWVYRETAAAGNYNINSGAHIWRTAPSGTAGNAISFTQAMTLDASGNLGINSTSPSTFGKVTVQVDGTTTPTNLTNVGPSSINLYAAANGGSTNSTMGIFGWNATTGIGSGIGFVRENGSDWGTQIRFYTHPTTTSNIGDITERARITSGGNLLVGTTSQLINNARLSALGVYNSDSNTTTYSTQRAAAALYQDGGSSSNNQGSYCSLVLSINTGLAINPGALMRGYGGNGGSNYVIQINENGNITNANNSYGSLSDASIKENIVDATPKLNDLMAVKVRSYSLKDDEKKLKQLGVVAQELETVFPAMVETEADGLKSVKYSVFVPMLIKAIQEQQAIIESLTARITALEAK